MKRHLPCKIMILDFTHSFKNYDEILNFYDIWDYECPNPECRAKQHPMRRHAKYERNLIFWDDDAGQLKEERMEVLRLKCCSCGTTHSVLTMDMIPFFSYSIQAFLVLLRLCVEYSVPQTEEKTGVSFQLLYRFLQIFQEYAGKILLFLRQEGLWKEEGELRYRQILPLPCGKSPPWPQSSFFRRERTPIFLHRRNTVSYPLRFSAAIP